MTKIDFLKQKHLDMFDEKRNEHTEYVAKLYREYVSDKDLATEDKNVLFGDFYMHFAEQFPVEIYENERVVGTNWCWHWQDKLKDLPRPMNMGHYIPDFEGFLKKGIRGKLDDAKALGVGEEKSMLAFRRYVERHTEAAKKEYEVAAIDDRERLLEIAECCEAISFAPPATFRQALQLVWFILSFTEFEAACAAISLGRIDKYLYPYYKNDIEKGVITPEDALDFIMCFYIKTSEGDESTMLTVGGKEENELTSLFIEAQVRVNMRQPSIAVRICDTTSADVWEKAVALVLKGSGMPAFFNDDVVIKGLQSVGFDWEEARDYGIVGCYEASPQGVFSNTVASGFNLYKGFAEFVNQKNEYSSFEEFLDSYKSFFDAYYKNSIYSWMRTVMEAGKRRISPFADSVVKNKFPHLFGIDILGIGVLIDSIYTVKKLVFDEKYITLADLVAQAEQNFDNAELYGKIKSLDTHYGSDSDESNRLATELSQFISDVIRKNSDVEGVIPSPALFLFTGDIWQRGYGATLNGRRQGELMSYGVMPCATPHTSSLTSMLMSCAHIASDRFPNGCPTLVSMSKKDIEREGILPALIKSYFKAGGFHIAINTVNAEILENAQRRPEEYSDVMVKISGYSAQFTKMSEGIQNAVIERAHKE